MLRRHPGEATRWRGLLVVFGGLSGVHEAFDDVDEARRVVVKRNVPSPSKISNCEPGMAACAMSVTDWQHDILVPQMICTGMASVK